MVGIGPVFTQTWTGSGPLALEELLGAWPQVCHVSKPRLEYLLGLGSRRETLWSALVILPGEGAWSLLLLSSPHRLIEALGLIGPFEHYSLTD